MLKVLAVILTNYESDDKFQTSSLSDSNIDTTLDF